MSHAARRRNQAAARRRALFSYPDATDLFLDRKPFFEALSWVESPDFVTSPDSFTTRPNSAMNFAG